MWEVAEREVHVARHQRTQQVHIARYAVQLSKHDSGTDGLGVREGFGELGAVCSSAAFGFHVFGHERPAATIQIRGHCSTLCFSAKAAPSLFVGAHTEIRDELSA